VNSHLYVTDKTDKLSKVVCIIVSHLGTLLLWLTHSINFLKLLYEFLSIAENHSTSILFAISANQFLASHSISSRASFIIVASVLSIVPSFKAFCNTFKSSNSSHLKSSV